MKWSWHFSPNLMYYFTRNENMFYIGTMFPTGGSGTLRGPREVYRFERKIRKI
jgi:hypothetical protein